MAEKMKMTLQITQSGIKPLFDEYFYASEGAKKMVYRSSFHSVV